MPVLTNIMAPALFFLTGTIIGSFINVVALRYPSGLKPTGRSYCPSCRHKLSPLDLVPILSFIFLRGRCRYCGKMISVQYPLVELWVGLIYLILAENYFNGQLSFWQVMVEVVIVSLLVILFIIDLKTMILPDFFILILAAVVAIQLLLGGKGYLEAGLGAVIGSGFLLILWLVTQKKGIGFGDVKLMLPLGALFGIYDTVLLLMMSFMVGGLVGGSLLLTGKATMKTAIPFGPFLAGVAIVLILVPAIPEYLWGLMW